jgi:hypothetical protein
MNQTCYSNATGLAGSEMLNKDENYFPDMWIPCLPTGRHITYKIKLFTHEK